MPQRASHHREKQMPSKRKRVASRQAQLSRRKRRDRSRVPHQEVAPNVTGRAGSGASSEAVGMNPASGAASAVVERPALPGQERTRRNRPSRVRSEPLPPNTHLKNELKRIGILTTLMAIALAVLTVVLR